MDELVDGQLVGSRLNNNKNTSTSPLHQVGVSMSATLEAPKAAQIAETHVTTEVAETDVQTIKSEVDPLQEEELVPTTLITADNLFSIKLEPGLDEILETSDAQKNIDQNKSGDVEGDNVVGGHQGGCVDLEEDEEQGFSFYDATTPKIFKFAHGLSCVDLVQIHMDPTLQLFDIRRQPLLVLDKVDKYWPVATSVIKTEVKDEPMDIVEDAEWDRVAEAEIMAANEGFNEVVVANEAFEDELDVEVEKKAKKVRPRRLRKKPKTNENFDTNPDEPEEMSESERFDDEEDFSISEDDDVNDPSFKNSHSEDSDIGDDDSLNSLDMFGSDSNSADLSLVKQELGEGEEEEGISRANGLLASSQELQVVEIGGYKVETYGDYSKCPKCEKNIKSTFIIRHIKLHDLPSHEMKCPYESCATSFTRSNNMYRHLKVVHDDDNPYICVYKNCSGREHVNRAHRKGKSEEIEDLEGSNMRYRCEFPGCEREYGKKQHLKEHFRKHTGDMRYACDVCGERFFVHGHMKRHLYSHTGIKPHACRWKCGAIFASYGGRMKHERAQHSENPYKLDCDICGRPFRFDRELDKHKLTHLAPHERMAYRCSFCGIIFDSISHRERHEQRHKDNDTFECEDCHKMFKNEKNLRHHYKTHHELPHPKKTTAPGKQEPSAADKVRKNFAQESDKKDKKDPPKYPCHMCDIPVMFALTALRRHLARKHSTNYKCAKEGCDKTFAKQYQFDAHMKLHMHRSCHMCGKQFKRKQNADIHLMGVHGLTKDDLATLGR